MSPKPSEKLSAHKRCGAGTWNLSRDAPTANSANSSAGPVSSARPFIKLPDELFFQLPFLARIRRPLGLLEEPAQTLVAFAASCFWPSWGYGFFRDFARFSHLCNIRGSCDSTNENSCVPAERSHFVLRRALSPLLLQP